MKRMMICVAAFVLCVAATQFAMRGRHDSSGNTGYLGTEVAGVEGLSNGIDPAIFGVNGYGSSGTIAEGVYGLAGNGGGTTGVGVQGGGYRGVSGNSSSTLAGAAGIVGFGYWTGITGTADSPNSMAVGVSGTSSAGTGVDGVSPAGFGVRGRTTNGTGVYGVLEAGGSGHAGFFEGRVHVNGTLSKSAGSFRIDHPLDPAGKYLSHSFVESPDMKNLYDGVVTLDENGAATVELPEWFEALNTDFRYQLTCIGEHAPVYIAEEIAENRFRIGGGYAGMKVSWLVTGTRHDPYAEVHRIRVEETKPPHEAGTFLHPELYRQPPSQKLAPAVRR